MTTKIQEPLSQIKKIIDNQKFILLNIISPDEPGHIFSFTIGLTANFNIPELVFVEEDPEVARKIVGNVVASSELGLSVDEAVGYIDLLGAQLKTGSVPDAAVSSLAPQIKDFYLKYYPDDSEFSAQWIGRKDVVYPFESFMKSNLLEAPIEGPRTIQ